MEPARKTGADASYTAQLSLSFHLAIESTSRVHVAASFHRLQCDSVFHFRLFILVAFTVEFSQERAIPLNPRSVPLSWVKNYISA